MKHIWIWILIASFFAACQTESHEEGQHEETHQEEVAAEEAELPTYPEDSLGTDGRSFHGYRIDETEATPAFELVSFMGEKEEVMDMKVSGEVLAACQAKGCWMTLQMPDGQDMRVTFKDYGFFVPKDSPGKEAIVEGRAYYDTTSVDMLRHYAVDGGMSEEEAEKTYTEPEVTLAFEATGVIIKSTEE